MIVRHAKHRERERERERERGRWPCRKTWIKTRREGGREGGWSWRRWGVGTILRYWKSLWGSKFASEEDHVVQNNNYTHRQNHLNLIALTYCNHIRPHVYMCMKVEQSESHKVRRHDISGTLLVLLVSPGKLHRPFSIYLLYN